DWHVWTKKVYWSSGIWELWKKSANSYTYTGVFPMLRWRHWSSVLTENYCSVKRITVRLSGSGTWSRAKKFASFQVMKSAELWGFGIIEDFLRVVRIYLAPRQVPRNYRMERLSVCGMSDGGKSSLLYRFGMHPDLPILRVVRIWHAVARIQRGSYCGLSNVVKSIGGYRCRRDVRRRMR
ncbi:MAG: hypothetical protein MJE68_14520, partial [Proteobacteria bacterium]|nr:hypothetical protein [Pseudomonadota bacterium]